MIHVHVFLFIYIYRHTFWIIYLYPPPSMISIYLYNIYIYIYEHTHDFTRKPLMPRCKSGPRWASQTLFLTTCSSTSMSWGPRTLQRWMMLKSRIDFQSHEIHSSHNGTDFISMFECFYKSIYHHLYILIYSSWVLGLHSLWFYCMVVWNAVNKSKSIHQTMNMIWPWLHWSWTVTVAQSGFGCVGYIYVDNDVPHSPWCAQQFTGPYTPHRYE